MCIQTLGKNIFIFALFLLIDFYRGRVEASPEFINYRLIQYRHLQFIIFFSSNNNNIRQSYVNNMSELCQLSQQQQKPSELSSKLIQATAR